MAAFIRLDDSPMFQSQVMHLSTDSLIYIVYTYRYVYKHILSPTNFLVFGASVNGTRIELLGEFQFTRL